MFAGTVVLAYTSLEAVKQRLQSAPAALAGSLRLHEPTCFLCALYCYIRTCMRVLNVCMYVCMCIHDMYISACQVS